MQFKQGQVTKTFYMKYKKPKIDKMFNQHMV